VLTEIDRTLAAKAAWWCRAARLILACAGLRMTPATVLRRLTISAGSAGAQVP